jgi:hypothetical protein
MTLLTLIQYLLGYREAILRGAGCRAALGLGLVFVLVAGLAREYDGEDLLAEPWHVLIPLAASVVSSGVLYLLVRWVAWVNGAHGRAPADPHPASGHPLPKGEGSECRLSLRESTPFRGAKGDNLASGYLDFLGLYWLTAPLALVYAIPVERLMPPAAAVAANLWLLGLVAVWRVLLMARVVSVLYGRGFGTGLLLVMFFADTVTVIALGMMELPIVGIMGGIRLSPAESVLRNTVCMIRLVSVLTWPVWLIAAGVAAFRSQTKWEYQPASVAPLVGVRPHLWAIAGGCLAALLALLPLTQPAQQLRTQVERDLVAGRIREGLTMMSAHEPGDFPPHWDPPPRISYRQFVPDIVAVMEELDAQGTTAAPWVQSIYAEKFSNWLRGEYDFGIWRELPAHEAERIIGLVEQMPERKQLIRDHQLGLDSAVGAYSQWPAELQERTKKLLIEAGVEPPPSE